MAKQKILLTGASGSMGHAAFLELLKRKEEFGIVLLLRPSKKNRKHFSKYLSYKNAVSIQKNTVEYDGLKVVWGDLTNQEDVKKAVDGCSYVLHPAALISPAADHNPKTAKEVNLDGTRNIIAAIKKQPNNGDNTKFFYIGSVAEYGDRLSPIYRIRAGDPLMPSVYDFYATTKIAAERTVIDSGLKHWVSIRQTYIAIPNALSLFDPIMYHQPIDQHIELITNEDAGFGLVQCIDTPEDFWCKIYNMSGGPLCRFIYLEYLETMVKLLKMGDYRKIMDRNWFCLKNFHGGWFEDAQILNGYLHHWRHILKDHYQQVKDKNPFYLHFARIIPSFMIKRIMKRMANAKSGPLYWIKSNNEGRIEAFFGSKKKWAAIPDWGLDMSDFRAEAYLLDHGYDEKKPENKLTIGDMRKAASFRGGKCLSESFVDMASKLKWKCAFDHVFKGSPNLILKGGHWCPDCEAPPWEYDKIAKKNPFFAQAYYATHSRGKGNCSAKKG